MARFLSPAWFARLGALDGPGRPGGRATQDGQPPLARPDGDPFVIEQIVEQTPDGVVRYHVVVGGTRATVTEGPAPAPDVVFTSDYPTACAIHRGELSTESALLEGRLRVRGDLSRLRQRAPALAGIDPVPPRLRDETSY